MHDLIQDPDGGSWWCTCGAGPFNGYVTHDGVTVTPQGHHRGHALAFTPSDSVADRINSRFD